MRCNTILILMMLGVVMWSVAGVAEPQPAGEHQRRIIGAGSHPAFADDFAESELSDVATSAAPTTFTIDYEGSCLWTDMNDVVVEGDFAYCAFFNGLVIFDVSDPTNPDSVSFTYFQGRAKSLLKAGNLVLIANGFGGLLIVDVSVPSSPVLIGGYDTPGDAVDLHLEDTLVYLADGTYGMQVINIADPTNPQVIGTYDTPSYAQEVSTVDTLAFVADYETSLVILNVSDPMNPSFVASYDLNWNSLGVFAADTVVYVADRLGLRILSVADPAHPYILGGYQTPGYCYRVLVQDNLAYMSDYVGGLQVIDVSDPDNPVFEASYDTSGLIVSVAVDGDLAYLADASDGLRIIDLSQPDSDEFVGRYDTPYRSEGVAAVDSLVFVISGKDGLHIVNAADPANMVVLNNTQLPSSPYPANVLAADTLVFVTATQDGLQVVNVSDPLTPEVIGTHSAQGKMFLVDTLLYMADRPEGLQILDLADPANPALIGSVAIPGSGIVWAVFVQDTVAFAVGSSSGMQLISVANPANPYSIGGFDPGGTLISVFVDDTIAYVPSGYSGLRILSVADPLNPYVITTFDSARTSYRQIVLVDSLAYLTSPRGVTVVSVADPANPVTIGQYRTPGQQFDLIVQGPYVYLADDASLMSLKTNQLLPDLIVDIELTAYSDTRIDYDYVITNIGEGPCNLDGPNDTLNADNIGIQAVLSADTVYDPFGDVPAGGGILGVSPLGYLEPGESIDGSRYAVLTDPLDTLATPYVIVRVNQANLLPETNFSNNTDWEKIHLPPDSLLSVTLDIKPGSCPNPFNIRSVGARGKAVIPVAVLGTADFDVRDIDPATVMLEGVAAVRWAFEDIGTPIPAGAAACECHAEGGDGIEDMSLKFYREDLVTALEIVIDRETIPLTLSGQLYDGQSFEGEDCIVVHGDRAGGHGQAKATELFGSYPNPFNPTTVISFRLGSATDVRVIVFNVLGQQVATLVDEHLEAGEHSVTWNASSVGSGIYFYRLEAADFVKTCKMVFLK